MKITDNFNRLLVLLLLALACCIGLFWLPDSILGIPVKKVDMLSDIRIKETPVTLDSLRAQLQQFVPEDIQTVLINDSAFQDTTQIDIRTVMLRDSLYKVVSASQGADSAGIRIEDYSVGHTGLQRFFAALKRTGQMGRPVRIAFMGDSFVEGDILVSDFRNAMQKRFGGHGVGFIPVASTASQFRPTIDQQAEGWTTRSIIHNKKEKYTLSGMFFECKSDKATLSFKTSDRYATLQKVKSLKFIYEKTSGVDMELAFNDSTETLSRKLDSPEPFNQFVVDRDTITEGSFIFSNAKGFRSLGIALEDNEGIVVDNFSLRGNSGLVWEHLDPEVCRSFSNIRPYDLIILEYGLNAMDEDMLDYGWYRSRMVGVVKHLQTCFPDADLLLISISDRSNQYDGEFRTMPAVLALLHAQRQIARNAGIPFWNMFGAMGGENSMVEYVEKGWASKDYTHLSFRGGREIAKSLMNALMLEKEFYDETEKAVH